MIDRIVVMRGKRTRAANGPFIIPLITPSVNAEDPWGMRGDLRKLIKKSDPQPLQVVPFAGTSRCLASMWFFLCYDYDPPC